MLYIWPYIVFFSFPLLSRNFLGLFIPRELRSTNSPFQEMVGHPSTIAAITLLMLFAVHFNTIVHPFTLADNRHYVFYVFRWILLRHPLAKYLAVPIYMICSRAVLTALEGSSRSHLSRIKPTTPEQTTNPQKPSTNSTRVSFILIWILTTSLLVITAPLVEPRYFILPWLFWRLHLPLPSMEPQRPMQKKFKGKYVWLLPLIASNGLWLETFWFLLVNLLTCYVFLYRGFTWPQQPGQVQRFMWWKTIKSMQFKKDIRGWDLNV